MSGIVVERTGVLRRSALVEVGSSSKVHVDQFVISKHVILKICSSCSSAEYVHLDSQAFVLEQVRRSLRIFLTNPLDVGPGLVFYPVQIPRLHDYHLAGTSQIRPCTHCANARWSIFSRVSRCSVHGYSTAAVQRRRPRYGSLTSSSCVFLLKHSSV